MKAKKIIAGLSAMALASTMAMSAFALPAQEEGAPTQINKDSVPQSGAMTATYEVEAKYTVTIPASVTLSSTETVSADITASDVLLESGQKIKVTLTGASNTESGSTFSAKNSSGESTATYTIGKGEVDSGVAVGDVVAEFTTSEEQERQMLSFSPASGETYAGRHTEVLTFGIEVEDAPTNVPVSSINLYPDRLDMIFGADPVTVYATVGPDGATNKELEWTCSDGLAQSVHIIPSEDTLSCLVEFTDSGEGQLIVRAKDGSGVTKTIDVTIDE